MMACVLARCTEALAPGTAPAFIKVVRGMAQTGVVGKALTEPLTVQVTDADGVGVAGVTVEWETTSGSIGVVDAVTDAEGIASALWSLGSSTGEQRARASSDGLGTVQFTATGSPDRAAVVTLSQEALLFGAIGESGQLEATAADRYGNAVPDPEVTWVSSAPAIISVDGTGLVTGLADGSAVITAVVDTARASVTAAVAQHAASVRVEPDGAVLTALEDAVVLTATVVDANGHPLPDTTTIIWHTEAPEIATVDQDGRVTAIGNGVATILAATSTLNGSVDVTVRQQPASITVTPEAATLEAIGDTLRLIARVRDSRGHVIADADPQWSSSAADVVAVDSNGLLTAIAEGDADITASAGSVSTAARITVTAPEPAMISAVGGDNQSADVGATLDLPLVVQVLDALERPLADITVAWAVETGGGSVSAPTSTTDAEGRASTSWTLGSELGTQTASATVTGLDPVVFSATALDTVNQPPTATITAPADSSAFDEGASIEFSGSAADPEDGELAGAALVWSSDLDGELGTGTTFTRSDLSVGIHRITLTATDADSAQSTDSVLITIVAPPPAPEPAMISAVDGNSQSVDIGATLDLPLVVQVLDALERPLADVTVAWAVETGGGSVSAPTSITDGDGRASISWTLGSEIGTQNASATVAGLDPVIFTATALDTVNQPPTATITAPADSASFEEGAAVSFEGSGSDPQDGALTDAALVWTSDLDGELGTGTTFTRSDLSVGTHNITLTATDADSAQSTDSVVITIVAPPPAPEPAMIIAVDGNSQSADIGATLDVPLVVQVLDALERPLADVTVAWAVETGGGGVSAPTSTTDADGRASISWTLGSEVGTQTALATVAGLDPVIFTATALDTVNQPPTVAITAPVDSAVFDEGASIEFSGSAADPEDGELAGAALVWSSDLDGELGTGTTFTRSDLSVGTHNITLTATDADSAQSTDSVVITIVAPPPAPEPAMISAVDGNSQSADIGATLDLPLVVQVLDALERPLADITVAWAVETGGGSVSAPTSTTDADGRASISWTLGSDVGTQTALATVTGLDPVIFTATALDTVNQPPTATITAPADSSAFDEGASIEFSGSAADPEDGELAGAALVWSSDLDGELGTGTTFTRSDLSVGTHHITLTATDADSAQSSDSVTVVVNAVVPPSSEVVWVGGAAAGPTSWFVADNWSTGTVPTQTDSVAIPIVSSAPVLNDSAAAGLVRVTGTLTLAAGRLYADVDNSGTIEIAGGNGSRINGAVVNGGDGTLRLNGNNGHAHLTLAGSLTNNGLVQLTGTSWGAVIVQESGTLVNAAGATLTVTSPSSITASVTNEGTLDVQRTLTISNSGRMFTSLTGTLNVEPEQMLQVSAGTMRIGSATPTTGTGTIQLTSTHTLALDSDFTIRTGEPVWDLAGTVTVQGPGVLRNEAMLVLSGDVVDTDLANTGTFEIAGGNGSRINGVVTNPLGATTRLNGNNGHAHLTLANGFTNGGLLELTGTNWGGTVVLESGVLTNAAGATLTVTSPSSITASVTNEGTLDVQRTLTISNSGRMFTSLTGTLNVEPDQMLQVSAGTMRIGGATPTTGTGTIQLTSTHTLVLESDFTIRDSEPVWDLSGTVTVQGPGTLRNEAMLVLSGDVVATDLANTGTLEIAGGNGSRINGVLTNPLGATTRLNGNNGGSHLTLASSFTNGGLLELTGTSWGGTVVLESGVLTNAAGAMLLSTSASNITAPVTNEGTLDVQRNLTISNGGRTFTSLTGTLNVAADQVLNVSAGTMRVSSATPATGTGTIQLTSTHTLVLDSDFTIRTGEPVWDLAGTVTVQGPGTLRNEAMLVLSGDVVATDLANTGTLEIAGGNGSRINGVLTNPLGATTRLNGNNGHAHLTLANGFTNAGLLELTGTSWGGSMVLESGVLTNAAGATLTVTSPSNVTASVTNEGTLDVQRTLTISNGDRTFTSLTGTLNVEPDQMLQVSAGTMRIGGATPTTGTGTIQLASTHTLALDSDFTIRTGEPVWDLAGTVTVQGPGTLRNEAMLVLSGDVVDTDLANTGTFEIAGGNGSRINGVLTNPLGATTRLNGNNGHAHLTLANGFTNGGLLELTGTSWGGSMVLESGVLTNAAGATLTVTSPSNVTASVMNEGMLHVQRSLTMSQADAAHSSTGMIDIAAGQTLLVRGVSFTNQSGGTLRGAGTVDVTGITFTNAGTLEPGASPGLLAVTGSAVQSSTAALNIELGGIDAGTGYDRLQISENAQLGGTLNITVINGFVAAEGQTFEILTSAARAGSFSSASGTDLGGGLVLQISYTATGVVLTVVSSTP